VITQYRLGTALLAGVKMANLTISRRAVLVASVFAQELLITSARSASAEQPDQLTPACGGDEVTLRQSPGPYYKPRSPLKDNFVGDVADGNSLLLAGKVSDPECRPLSNCMIEFWQADSNGKYDNRGFRLRGHQYTDSQGRYVLQTIVPGFYPGRTRHIHVNLKPHNGPLLTTQLYFPGEQRNLSDGLFSTKLLIGADDARRVGTFNFVVPTT